MSNNYKSPLEQWLSMLMGKTKTVSGWDGEGQSVGARVSQSKAGTANNDPQAYLLDGILGQEFVGTKKQVRNGLALSPDQVMQADLERQLNRASFSDAVQGMEEAGLNSALLYGQSSSPATAQVGDSQLQSQSEELAPLQSALSMLDTASSIATSSASLKIQKDQVDAQNNLARAQAELARAQAGKTKEETTGVQLDNRFLRDTYDLRVQAERGNVTKLEYENIALKWNNYILENSAQFQIDRNKYESLTAQYNSTMARLDSENRAEWIRLQNALVQSQIDSNDANRRKAEKEIIKMGKEIGLLDGELNWQQTEQWLSYIATAGTLLADVTGAQSSASTAGVNLAGLGFNVSQSQSFSGEVSGLTGMYGAILNTIKDHYAKSGLYHTVGPVDLRYDQISAEKGIGNGSHISEQEFNSYVANINYRTGCGWEKAHEIVTSMFGEPYHPHK